MSQRWRERRDTYRPNDDELFETRHHEVVFAPDQSWVRDFVTRHHYSGTVPNSTRFAFLLIDRRRPAWSDCGVVGAATFGSPSGPKVLEGAFPFVDEVSQAASELQRLVLLDQVRRNGESWFVARCFKQLRRESQEAVVSFSDPVARLDAEGVLVKPGHVGHVYQALGAHYTGRSEARWSWYRASGEMINRRDLTKIEGACPCCGSGKSVSGSGGAVERFVAWGAPAPARGACLRAWLASALPCVASRRRHGGNHRYLWGLTDAAKAGLVQLHGPASLDALLGAYPKEPDAA